MEPRIVKHDSHKVLDVSHPLLDAVLVKEDVEHIAFIQIDVTISNLRSGIRQAIDLSLHDRWDPHIQICFCKVVIVLPFLCLEEPEEELTAYLQIFFSNLYSPVSSVWKNVTPMLL